MSASPAAVRSAVALALGVLLAAVAPLSAQDTGTLAGLVTSEDTGEPLTGVAIEVGETGRGALTNEQGRFLVRNVPAGTHEVRATSLGYRTATRAVDVPVGNAAQVEFVLALRPVEVGGIQVSVLRPDLQPQAELTEREVRRANPKDAGQLLRSLTGMDAVRRGPLGLDPVVRGLRETEVGTYLDGTRLFPAGPARMDSPLTHLDPSAVSDIQVVKGPYALTWGSGNLSAIRVETQELPERGARVPRGSVNAGYDSNLQAAETYGTFSGRGDRVSYWVHGAWRDGDDYESGAGEAVPGDFRSWEGRGKVGLDVTENSLLSVSGGYQEQGPIDYPGRLLNAEFFESVNLSARWQTERSEGLLRALDVIAYRNDVDHGMDNRGKPTAEPMEGRMPPFALDVTVDAGIDVWGGRAAADLQTGPWTFRVGGDVYDATRDAVRTIRRRDDGTLLFEDLMWPDATIRPVGVFARAGRNIGGVRVSGTLRLDHVRAEADTASDFFRENVSTDLETTETSLSAATTVGFDVSDRWNLSLGLGSAVRTADASERYGDRIPASKAQTSAEFVGNPTLDPERSNQLDAWLEGRFPSATVQFNLFGRRVDDYITIEATDLPKRLPLSPDIVYQYVNGEATFWGAEASVLYGITDVLTAQASGSYLRGHDDLVDEPALGVSPLDGRVGLRYEERGGRYFVEGDFHAVASQDRVSVARGELETDGYTTLDVRGGWAPGGGVNLRFGVENVFDQDYVNHLNAKNPFTGSQLPEPGRVFFLDASYGF